MADEPNPEETAAIEKIEKMTKAGFDLKSRLQNRGLRKATITLYLDEELGPKLGYATDILNAYDHVTGRERGGVVGELDEMVESRDKLRKQHEKAVEDDSEKMTAPAKKKAKDAFESADAAFDEPIAELEKKRDEMTAQLASTGLRLELRAVPPVIEKDCRRKARASLEIKGKGIPEDMKDEFTLAVQGHLMSVLVQTVTDNLTEDVNEGMPYEDAVAMIEYLPTSQFIRLDQKMGELQYADAISRAIEGQEDFS